MNRELFFSRRPATKRLDIDGLGTIHIRKLSQAEVEEIKRKYGKPEQSGEAARFAVSKAVVDADGERLFKDEDKAELLKVDFDIVEITAKEIAKFSGLVKDEDDADPKPPSAGSSETPAD